MIFIQYCHLSDPGRVPQTAFKAWTQRRRELGERSFGDLFVFHLVIWQQTQIMKIIICLVHSCLAEKYIIGEINDIYVKNMPFFCISRWGRRGQIFLGAYQSVFYQPQKNCESAQNCTFKNWVLVNWDWDYIFLLEALSNSCVHGWWIYTT